MDAQKAVGTFAAFVALSRVKKFCEFCKKGVSLSNFKRHVASCDLNPKNVRECPVCKNPILHKKYSVCSRACSNTQYRTKFAIEFAKENKPPSYREICFESKKHECVVCGEKEVIDVHHFDEDKTNNKVENLIPLCPTHHRYVHTKRLRQIVVDAIRGIV